MGKGGQSNIKKAKTVSKLAHLQDAELRKWAVEYGVKEQATREGLLEALAPYAGGILDKDRPANLPLAPPKFKLTDIRNAIPAHCFQRSFFHSFCHLVSDIAMICVIGYLGSWIGHPSLPLWSSYVLWPIYWYSQGSVFTGIWVLAHECGHQAFSESELINNTFGTVLHSLLLVPYHSWRISHGKHHSNTGSCDNDEVFAPSTRADFGKEMLRETPLAHLFGIVIMLTVGWMPGYLLFNMSGPKKYKGKNNSHFSPTSVLFDEGDYWLIVQTDIAFFMALGLLAYCCSVYGFKAVFMYYVVPYLITNYHLVLITYLQHTDVFLPHFRGPEWNWLRGALCTVDRSFGPLLDHTFHHIVDTHVCHHLFSKMPFYHAQEATEKIREVLGPYYLKDETPIAKALWRSFTNCQFIEDEGDVVFYKSEK